VFAGPNGPGNSFELMDELIARGAVRFEGDKRWRRYWAA
jgi:hypothetical protein